MQWFIQLFTGQSVSHTLLVLSLVVSSGLALGRIGFFGIKLGIAGVLFSGLAFGHFRITIEPELMHFIREFGLVLFVYAIGLQVGPCFVSWLSTACILLACPHGGGRFYSYQAKHFVVHASHSAISSCVTPERLVLPTE